jgi:hypothetical protein
VDHSSHRRGAGRRRCRELSGKGRPRCWPPRVLGVPGGDETRPLPDRYMRLLVARPAPRTAGTAHGRHRARQAPRTAGTAHRPRRARQAAASAGTVQGRPSTRREAPMGKPRGGERRWESTGSWRPLRWQAGLLPFAASGAVRGNRASPVAEMPARGWARRPDGSFAPGHASVHPAVQPARLPSLRRTCRRRPPTRSGTRSAQRPASQHLDPTDHAVTPAGVSGRLNG